MSFNNVLYWSFLISIVTAVLQMVLLEDSLHLQHTWFWFVFLQIIPQYWNWISTPFILCKETFKSGQSKGKERARIGKPHLTLSLPSLCPHFALTLVRTSADRIQWIHRWKKKAIFGCFTSNRKIKFRFQPVEHLGKRCVAFGIEKKCWSF